MMKPGSKQRAVVLAMASVAVLAGAADARTERTELPGRRADRSVYDRAGVISADDRALLERVHTELFAKTGVAIVLITVPALEGETISGFAVRAGQDWGVGRKGEDRGVVVAFSARERELFVATGYGVEGFLPDGKVGGLIDDHALPELRQDRFSSGLTQLCLALAQVAAHEYNVTLSAGPRAPPRPRAQTEPSWSDSIGTLILVVLGFLFFLYMLIRHPRALARFIWWMIIVNIFSGRGRGGGGGGFGGGGFGGFGGGGFGGGGAGRRF